MRVCLLSLKMQIQLMMKYNITCAYIFEIMIDEHFFNVRTIIVLTQKRSIHHDVNTLSDKIQNYILTDTKHQ